MRTTLIIFLSCVLPLGVLGQSTSPNPHGAGKGLPIAIGPASTVITFSEFSVGTSISTQYQNVGIHFGGSGPFITTDGANPTSPVLSGSPLFQGDITGTFVEPGSSQPTVVESFTFDAGYFDEIGSTRIEWFDPHGKKLGQRINSHFGIERFTIEGGNIASWRIGIVQTEPAGFAIDNVSFVPLGPSVLFRERSDDHKDGSWGLSSDEIPGFDHSAFQIGNLVYESHPGYQPAGTYVSADGQETAFVATLDGVQAQHTRKTFRHDSLTPGVTAVVDFEEIPVKEEIARMMRDKIQSVRGAPFQRINYSIDGLAATLAPAVQKGGNGKFTCVGLVEWSAEQAGVNGGQGFIPNRFESFTLPLPSGSLEVPLLSPQLLNYAMKGQQLLQDAKQWVQGLFDPVDFIVIDPLGRRLGFVQGVGRLNEIPNAFYTGDGGVEQFLILNSIPGNYTIQRVGTGADVFAAVGALGSSESFSGHLAAGEVNLKQMFVQPKAGCAGDVDGDGDVDADDIQALRLLLNRFTDGLGHPGDLDGDGLLSNTDVVLLTRLVAALAPFDFCLQDDSSGKTFQINLTTGAYRYTDCTGFTLDGTGSLIKRGEMITLQHTASDRRVVATMDQSVHKGSASVQIFSLRTTFTITDRDTGNNTCSCPNH